MSVTEGAIMASEAALKLIVPTRAVEDTIPGKLALAGKIVEEAIVPMDLPDWEMTARQIEALEFEPDEFFGVTADKYSKHPVMYTVAEWLEWLRAGNSIQKIAKGKDCYFCINPMIERGRRLKTNIKTPRNLLVEMENKLYTRGQQLSILRQAREYGFHYQCLVDSTGKSIHAIVRIDAKDEAEYKAVGAEIFSLFGTACDPGNLDIGRYSRLAGGYRGTKLQALLEIK